MRHEAVELLSRYLKIDTTNPPGNEHKGVAFFAEILEKEENAAAEQELDQDQEIEPQSTDEETLSDIMVEEFESSLKKIDMSDLLENKKMTKIIEVVFDYDMEDLTNTMDQIANCSDIEKANDVLDTLYATNRINQKSKEAQVFRDLISGYFD